MWLHDCRTRKILKCPEGFLEAILKETHQIYVRLEVVFFVMQHKRQVEELLDFSHVRVVVLVRRVLFGQSKPG